MAENKVHMACTKSKPQILRLRLSR
jgi:hypothetical protein